MQSMQRVHSVPHTGGACFNVRDTSLRSQKVFTKTSACVISDIVKRRSIRAGSPPSVLQNLFCFSPARPCAYLQTVFGAWPSQDVQVVKQSLSATLDRIAIGSILRSNLVFLISIHLHDMRSSRARFARSSVQTAFCRVCGY